jgi:hypothetical protein
MKHCPGVTALIPGIRAIRLMAQNFQQLKALQRTCRPSSSEGVLCDVLQAGQEHGTLQRLQAAECHNGYECGNEFFGSDPSFQFCGLWVLSSVSVAVRLPSPSHLIRFSCRKDGCFQRCIHFVISGMLIFTGCSIGSVGHTMVEGVLQTIEMKYRGARAFPSVQVNLCFQITREGNRQV